MKLEIDYKALVEKFIKDVSIARNGKISLDEITKIVDLVAEIKYQFEKEGEK